MSVYYSDESVTLHHGDALEVLQSLEDGSVNCCVTSPPYYALRDYGIEGQYGLEESPAAYVETMRALFAEVRRVLHDDGTLWLNIGDSYASSTKGSGGATEKQATNVGSFYAARKFNTDVPAKNLMGIPWRVAFALQDDGWILRNDVIWAKPNAMPESVTDRLSTKHEHLFMFAKQARYWFDLDAVRDEYSDRMQARSHYAGRPDVPARLHDEHGKDGGRARGILGLSADGLNPSGKNPGDVWSIPTQPYPGAHFAVMPQTLASRCIQAGCKPGGTVLDPFSGSGTTGLAAAKHGRRYVGIDLNADYLDLSLKTRLAQPALMEEL